VRKYVSVRMGVWIGYLPGTGLRGFKGGKRELVFLCYSGLWSLFFSFLFFSTITSSFGGGADERLMLRRSCNGNESWDEWKWDGVVGGVIFWAVMYNDL
jgi:hypothetical protein